MLLLFRRWLGSADDLVVFLAGHCELSLIVISGQSLFVVIGVAICVKDTCDLCEVVLVFEMLLETIATRCVQVKALNAVPHPRVIDC